MWAKFVSDICIYEAPKKYKGIENFDTNIDMLVKNNFKQVKFINSADNMQNPKIKYSLNNDFILAEYYDINKKITDKDLIENKLKERDALLYQYSVSRFKNKSVPISADDGKTTTLEDENNYLKAYYDYLNNIENDKNFPNVSLLSFIDWINLKKRI